METLKSSKVEETLHAGLESFNSLKEKMLSEEGLEELKGSVEELADEATKLVRKYPGRSLAGAFVAGILVGAWINRR